MEIGAWAKISVLLFSVPSLIRLFEIAIYLWLGSIGDTTEFQFAFRVKITWNRIIEVINCRRIILVFSLLKRSLFRNRYYFGLVTQRELALQRGIDGVVWRNQTMAAKETTISEAPIHFISAYKYLGNGYSRP